MPSTTLETIARDIWHQPEGRVTRIPNGIDIARESVGRAELLKSLKDPENAKKIAELGYELAPSSPAELAAHTAAELKKWTEVAKAADVKPD